MWPKEHFKSLTIDSGHKDAASHQDIINNTLSEKVSQ